MLSEAALARVKASVREQQLRQRWRLGLLWALRICYLLFLVLVLKAALQWPFDNFGDAVDRCLQAEPAAARACLRAEAEGRRLVAGEARRDVLALLAFIALTFVMAFLVRFGLGKQLKEHIRFSEEVFDAVPLQLSLRTPDGVFMRVNATFERAHSLRHEDIVGRHFSAYFPERVVRDVQELDGQVLATHLPVEREFDYSEPGAPRHVLLRLQAVRDEDGAALGIVVVHTDITVLRAHEEELEARNEQLRQLSTQMIDAQESERRRIARDLHDEVGQILTALKLQLGSLAKRGAIDDPRSALTMSLEFADEALRHTRDLSASLHPHLLDDLGLEPALNWLGDRFIRPLVPTLELRCRLEPPRGPQQIEFVAFRVVQEALTNVVRHARASRIGVILETGEGQLTIEVIDDGAGFDEALAGSGRAASLGLGSMRERVAEAGGELEVDSTAGVGTRVRAKLPWTGA